MPINDENISSDDTPKEKVKKKSKFSWKNSLKQ
jgi:hypothetical protein